MSDRTASVLAEFSQPAPRNEGNCLPLLLWNDDWENSIRLRSEMRAVIDTHAAFWEFHRHEKENLPYYSILSFLRPGVNSQYDVDATGGAQIKFSCDNSLASSKAWILLGSFLVNEIFPHASNVSGLSVARKQRFGHTFRVFLDTSLNKMVATDIIAFLATSLASLHITTPEMTPHKYMPNRQPCPILPARTTWTPPLAYLRDPYSWVGVVWQPSPSSSSSSPSSFPSSLATRKSRHALTHTSHTCKTHDTVEEFRRKETDSPQIFG
eukprot:NODE_1131_length_1089_cov_312.454808_g864_i0.p1 GENE.NODE_1131_length_1089_cov_312.454808_g864_i0~~NODE_1131_length_1089_cov_312.454808_g864_i0.p1  ORF type:complete len:285 (+),score=31.54 NODE_1131_length_1089_cov_312.454808_g864_i0:57-857(+)